MNERAYIIISLARRCPTSRSVTLKRNAQLKDELKRRNAQLDFPLDMIGREKIHESLHSTPGFNKAFERYFSQIQQGTFLQFTHGAGEAYRVTARTYIFICITLHSNRSILRNKRENRCGKGHPDIFLMFMH